MTDFIESLGSAFLAHRLRRLSDQLVEGCGDWLSTVGVSAPPNAASTLMLLRDRGPLPVAEIAAELRSAPSLVAAVCRELVRLGLANREPADRDRRRWPVTLTFEGRKEAERVATATRVASEAYGALFQEIGVDLLAAMHATEEALENFPLAERLSAIAEGRQPKTTKSQRVQQG